MYVFVKVGPALKFPLTIKTFHLSKAISQNLKPVKFFHKFSFEHFFTEQ